MMVHLPVRSTASRAVVLALAGWAMAVGAAPPGDAVVQRRGADLVVSWKAAGPVDVLVADRLVSARDADGTASLYQTGLSHPVILLRNAATGETTRVAERALPLEAGSNFRDIGGYPAAAGRHVRWGMIYRSGATPLLTPTDRQRIAALGLANMVDLRSDEERVLAPSRIDGVPYTAVGYSMAMMFTGGQIGDMGAVYRGLPAMLAPQMKQIFARLLRAEGPLAYNCSAGQDRTGFATAVILSALGTPYGTVVQDYHLSTALRRPEFEMPHIDAATAATSPIAGFFARVQDDPRARVAQPLKTADGKPFLDFAFAEMHDRWGGVDGYLAREIGLTPRDIARLRALYTE
jgi:protein-tyrosine phosphatase